MRSYASIDRSILVSKRRSDIKIMIGILKVALRGAGKTEIVYKADLNFGQARKYLDFLMKRGLIDVSNSSERGRRYRTTEKGKVFAKRYKEAIELVA